MPLRRLFWTSGGSAPNPFIRVFLGGFNKFQVIWGQKGEQPSVLKARRQGQGMLDDLGCGV